MPTLYVDNVPEDLYEALRARAQQSRKSISAEVITLLSENIPTAPELARRRKLIERAGQIRSRKPQSKGPFASAEEMLRDDRSR
jgi:plasmid stability protein